MIIYLIETLGILLASAVVFFSLGVGLGWVNWGRLRKISREWQQNSLRLNDRIAALEEERDRNEILVQDIDSEKNELVEIIAIKDEYTKQLEAKLEEASDGLRNAFCELEAREGEVSAIERGKQREQERVRLLEEKLAERNRTIEQIDDRYLAMMKDRDDKIAILRAKLLAAEQSLDAQRAEVSNLAKRLASTENGILKQTSKKPVVKKKRATRAVVKKQSVAVDASAGDNDPINPDQQDLGLNF